jgi:hypothetical protein
MRRGVWHQCGDRSQKLVEEQLEQGLGVGVIVSPRDLARDNAVEYTRRYKALGAEVLIDQQFYNPSYTNDKLGSYPLNDYRVGMTRLHQLTDFELADVAERLYQDSVDFGVDAVLAPAVLYEAGRADLVTLNAKLFRAAKTAGERLGKPTYATVVFGRSLTSSDQALYPVLGQASGLEADGWYYGFEFEAERIPSSPDAVFRACRAGLTLAGTGKPVLHGYAGPMALLSLGFGSTGAAVGHSQNLWRFTPERWQPPSGQGGGGDAPARFFSGTLWGTIVHPDELAQLPQDLRQRILTRSPFSGMAASDPPPDWSRWDANKHLLHVICSTVQVISAAPLARENAQAAITMLRAALDLHAEIAATGLELSDDSNAYQGNWLVAIERLLLQHGSDYNFLELLNDT